ncbi:unnamed protein product [Rangifer tarandus platyrhynchus]|uniref:Uncharacterized protein n=1 Tax=Rangifer tarandus platyrhynchus TaxID=3082113 RepID=A0ABN8ZMQ8_RANTA|nr:unnamed protein product [Rangifer tarandus platyrhynchus]
MYSHTIWHTRSWWTSRHDKGIVPPSKDTGALLRRSWTECIKVSTDSNPVAFGTQRKRHMQCPEPAAVPRMAGAQKLKG